MNKELLEEREEANKIEKYLNGLEHDYQGRPIFRLSWADDQFEMREGDFNEFKGDLFVRRIHGIKRTLKYPQLKGLYILEQLFDADRVQTDAIRDHNCYECFYAFRDAKFNRLPLRLRVVELIIKGKMIHRKSPMLSKSINEAIIAEKENRAYQADMDMIDTSSIESSLHLGDGISMYISKSKEKLSA